MTLYNPFSQNFTPQSPPFSLPSPPPTPVPLPSPLPPSHSCPLPPHSPPLSRPPIPTNLSLPLHQTEIPFSVSSVIVEPEGNRSTWYGHLVGVSGGRAMGREESRSHHNTVPYVTNKFQSNSSKLSTDHCSGFMNGQNALKCVLHSI